MFCFLFSYEKTITRKLVIAIWPWKTAADDDRNIVRAVKKNPKIAVTDINNNLQKAGVKV